MKTGLFECAPDMGDEWRALTQEQMMARVEALTRESLQNRDALEAIVFAACTSTLDWARGKKLDPMSLGLTNVEMTNVEMESGKTARQIASEGSAERMLRVMLYSTLRGVMLGMDPVPLVMAGVKTTLHMVALNPALADYRGVRH